jgi:hypothetical protein
MGGITADKSSAANTFKTLNISIGIFIMNATE